MKDPTDNNQDGDGDGDMDSDDDMLSWNIYYINISIIINYVHYKIDIL